LLCLNTATTDSIRIRRPLIATLRAFDGERTQSSRPTGITHTPNNDRCSGCRLPFSLDTPHGKECC
jgi:hypothetical protein